ncbi:MAG: hypothetical protein HY724_00795 [Candidatus Rokubacteria bacterium]|nr:hypothetical protein [Candidatus Rokubacteria bacterium]
MSHPQDTHPELSAQVEAAWARFRNGPGGMLLQESLTLRSSYLASIGLPRLPPEVTLPGAIPWNLLAKAEAEARGKAIGDTLSAAGTILAQSVATWAAYREAKTCYRVEPVLAEALGRTPWPVQVPTEALRLPSRCPVLTLPWEGETVHVAAYYDLLTSREQTGELELRLVRLEDAHWWAVSILHLFGQDLGACVRSAGARVEMEGGPADAFKTDLAGLVLTVLLYLGGEPDLVRQVHPGAKPAREARMQQREPERWKDLRSPALFAVGTAYRAAIERWEQEQAKERGEPTGRTVRPHVRRAHAHLYWTGAGRKTPRVRFLLPIPVKGAPVPEERPAPMQTPIR